MFGMNGSDTCFVLIVLIICVYKIIAKFIDKKGINGF